MAEAEVQDEYPDSPQGLAARWSDEMSSAKEVLDKWWKRADKIVKRFLDDRAGSSSSQDQGDTRLNLFTANTTTLQALLFGKTPKVDVGRRFQDSQDDQARVASEMLERLLNSDMERSDDSTVESFRNALQDRLISGLGNVRLRYEATLALQPDVPAIIDPATGAELAPAVPGQEIKTDEDVKTEYVFWRDQMWSPCKTFDELRWWAFSVDMSRPELVKRFGEEKARNLPMTTSKKGDTVGEKVRDPLARCTVWEIWSKERREVCWYVQGWPTVLDQRPDPLGLDGFWPFPRPMFANLTTSKLLPTPDFTIAQDLYDEVDSISTRITLLERVLRAAGVYDKNSEGIRRLISETVANELIPVDNWSMFAEKGGVKGLIDWLPLDQIIGALEALRGYRTELISLLFQVTGMSDIMRGQASGQATATEQSIKARFASVRVQSLQDEFARFCTETQRIKAEIIAKHFDPQTIMERSNILRTPDAQLAQPAVELIKSHLYEYRIAVNPDSVSLPDMAAIKAERFEYLTALSQFFGMSQPIVTQMPQAMPFLLQIASWALAGLKGSQQIEGVFDQAALQLKALLAQKEASPQQTPPDPKLQTAQVKAEAEQFRAKMDVQHSVIDLQAKKTEHQMEMQKLAVEHATTMQQENVKQRKQGLQAVREMLPQPGEAPPPPVEPAPL